MTNNAYRNFESTPNPANVLWDIKQRTREKERVLFKGRQRMQSHHSLHYTHVVTIVVPPRSRPLPLPCLGEEDINMHSM